MMTRRGVIGRACVTVAALAWLASPAAGQTEFGVRAGYADVKGDVFSGSDALGDLKLLGLQARLPLADWAQLEIAGEGTTRDFDFHDVAAVGEVVHGKARYEDTALYASLLAHVIPASAGPIGLYAGAGAGVHFTKVEIEEVEAGAAGRPDSPEDTIDDWKRDIEEEASDFEWHGLVGASFELPVVPLVVFGEGRFRDITGTRNLRALAAYAGLNLRIR